VEIKHFQSVSLNVNLKYSLDHFIQRGFGNISTEGD